MERRVFPKESIPGDTHTFRHNQLEVDVYKLIHLAQELPEKSIPVEDLMDDLGDQCWTDENNQRIRPQEVIDAYRSAGSAEKAVTTHPELAKHIRKIEAADSSFPILIFESRVVDGMHRLVKMVLQGQSSIKVKFIDEMPEAAIMKVHDSE